MEEKSRFLKRDSGSATKSYSAPSTGSLDSMVSACVSELMNAGTAMHKLHLKITSTGSYAAHKALNKLYDALPDHADDLAEGFQGASEKLLTYTEVAPKTLNSVAEAIDYLKDMTKMVDGLQAKMPYSEIVNDLDTIKSTINSGKYKLLFLK
jgi:DNA-binding ferritin-like protein